MAKNFISKRLSTLGDRFHLHTDVLTAENITHPEQSAPAAAPTTAEPATTAETTGAAAAPAATEPTEAAPGSEAVPVEALEPATASAPSPEVAAPISAPESAPAASTSPTDKKSKRSTLLHGVQSLQHFFDKKTKSPSTATAPLAETAEETPVAEEGKPVVPHVVNSGETKPLVDAIPIEAEASTAPAPVEDAINSVTPVAAVIITTTEEVIPAASAESELEAAPSATPAAIAIATTIPDSLPKEIETAFHKWVRRLSKKVVSRKDKATSTAAAEVVHEEKVPITVQEDVLPIHAEEPSAPAVVVEVIPEATIPITTVTEPSPVVEEIKTIEPDTAGAAAVPVSA